jgi:hypothetical protein
LRPGTASLEFEVTVREEIPDLAEHVELFSDRPVALQGRIEARGIDAEVAVTDRAAVNVLEFAADELVEHPATKQLLASVRLTESAFIDAEEAEARADV